MTYYPVVIPTLNRYEKFKACIESLVACKESKFTELVIGYDYPPSEKYRDGWEKIGEYIKTITGFKKITVLSQTKNIGSGKNCDLIKAYALQHYDAYIYSEDDNVVSPYFLKFINEGLEKFRDDESVIAICGYSYPINWGTEKDCVLQHQYFSAWGYGTWNEKNKQLQNDLNNNFIKRTFRSSSFYEMKKKSKANYINYMGFIFNDEIEAFDITRSFYMFLTNKAVLMPAKTLVTNDGWDGSGEHCKNKSIIDFSNPNRNNLKPLNINFFEDIYSDKLDSIFNSMFNKRIKTNIIYFLVISLGIYKVKKIKKIVKRITL